MLGASLLALAASFATAPVAFAGENGNFSSPCSQSDSKMSFGNYELSTDCDAAFYCADNSTCAYKGCRRDIFPFGYLPNATLPPFCGDGFFCPDEEDACLPVLAVDSPCQLNRDDECQPPDDKSLAGSRNHNGAVCLNFVCMWANATLGTSCVIENMPYVVYDQAGGHEYNNIVSRDNCANNLYCDGTKKQCLQQKNLGDACDADKECSSFNCNLSGKCDHPTNYTKHVAGWVYGVIGAAIIGSMIGIFVSLYFFHQKTRKVELEKRAQYWREQEAFRNNILSMRQQARESTLSLPRGGQGAESYSDYPSESGSGSRGMMYTSTKSSGLRNGFGDDNSDADSMQEALVPMRGGDEDDYGGQRRGRGAGGRV